MITELRVRDLATIADVTLPLGPGLNVLTGETGAGKSMLVDAWPCCSAPGPMPAPCVPERRGLSVEGVVEVGGRRGQSRAVVAMLEELGLELEEASVIIRREVSSDGRSRAWVNGSPTTISVLSQLGRTLVDMHGQHDTQTLLHPEHQRGLLDAFADAEDDARRVAAAWAEAQRLSPRRTALQSKRGRSESEGDYLRHVVQEIDAARIKPAEDESLDSEARKLSQAGSLSELAHKVAELVGGDEQSALKALARADRTLSALEKADPDTAAWREMLDGAFCAAPGAVAGGVGLRRRIVRRSGSARGDRAAPGSFLSAEAESTVQRSPRSWRLATQRRPSWSCSILRTSTSKLWRTGGQPVRRTLHAWQRCSPGSAVRAPSASRVRSIACSRSWACPVGSCRWRSIRSMRPAARAPSRCGSMCD
jgi:hypothetical protein